MRKSRQFDESEFIRDNELRCFDSRKCLADTRLSAVRYLGYVQIHLPSRRKTHYWLCHCTCGKTIQVKERDLRYNRVKSCGCWDDGRRARFSAQRIRKKS